MPQPYLKRIVEDRATLSREEARDLMQQVLGGQFADLELAALLGAITARGESPGELAGFVDAMRADRHARAAESPGARPAGRYLRHWRRFQRHLQHLHRCGPGRAPRKTPPVRCIWSPSTAIAPSPRSADPPMCWRRSASRLRFRRPMLRTPYAPTASPFCMRPRCIRR